LYAESCIRFDPLQDCDFLYKVPSLQSLEEVIQQQQDSVSRHTSFINDLHSRCDALQLTTASCLHGLPVVHQLLQVNPNTHLTIIDI
jgi:hypothetical protein